MPVNMICPFFLVFYKTTNNQCIESKCALWSKTLSICSFLESAVRLSSIDESLKSIAFILDSFEPTKD